MKQIIKIIWYVCDHSKVTLDYWRFYFYWVSLCLIHFLFHYLTLMKKYYRSRFYVCLSAFRCVQEGKLRLAKALEKKSQCECWLQEAGVADCVCMCAWRTSCARCQLPLAILVTQQDNMGRENLWITPIFLFDCYALLTICCFSCWIGFGGLALSSKHSSPFSPPTPPAIHLSVWDIPHP